MMPLFKGYNSKPCHFMKIKLIISSLLCAIGVSAQTNQVSNMLTNGTSLDQIFKVVGNNIGTNYGVEVYGTYAKDAPTKYGGGMLLIYNFTEIAGAGIGLDWLGSWNIVSANLQLKLPFHPLPNQLPNVMITPFALGGVATAYGGNYAGDVCTVQDVGGFISFGHVWGGSFNLGAAWGKWSGDSPYCVNREHLFIGWAKGF